MPVNNKRFCLLSAVLLLICLTFLGTACNNKNTDKLTARAFFPTSIGSSWKYQGSGNEYAAFTREVVFASSNRVQMKENNGGTMTDTVYEITDTQVKEIYFKPESYEKENYLEQTANRNKILLKLPLERGQTWEDAENEWEVVSENISVDTPAGKFDNCIKIKISPQPSQSTATTYEYYKQGIGMVKREFISGNQTISSTLEEYKIK